MKKFLYALVILGLVACLCKCSFRSDTYKFQNSLETVASIELLYNHNESPSGYDSFDFTSVRFLNPEEIESFMGAVYQLETARGGTPPRRGYGWYIAKIIYTNGDIEMLGSYNIEFIPSGEEQTGVGMYYFVDDTFTELFSKYIDISQYPQKE